MGECSSHEQRQQRREDEDDAEQADRLDQAHDDRIRAELVGDARDLRQASRRRGEHAGHRREARDPVKKHREQQGSSDHADGQQRQRAEKRQKSEKDLLRDGSRDDDADADLPERPDEPVWKPWFSCGVRHGPRGCHGSDQRSRRKGKPLSGKASGDGGGGAQDVRPQPCARRNGRAD